MTSPVYTRGANNWEEQQAMLRGGNPEAMQIMAQGRYNSATTPSKSKMSTYGKEPAPYTNYGQDRFRLNAALRGSGTDFISGDNGTPADANFDRMAPMLTKDAPGRELLASYGEASKRELERLRQARESMDMSTFRSVPEAISALSAGSDQAVRGFSQKYASQFLSKEDRSLIEASAFADRLTKESAGKDGEVTPKYIAGPDGKIVVANQEQLGDSARAKAYAEVTRLAPPGSRVVAESGANGQIFYKVEGGGTQHLTQDEINAREVYRLTTGRTVSPELLAPQSGVFANAGDLASKYGISGDVPDGKVSIERSSMNEADIGAIAKQAHEAYRKGVAQTSREAFEAGIKAVAEQRGISEAELAKSLGSTANAFEDTLSYINADLYNLLQQDADATRAQADKATKEFTGQVVGQLTGKAAGEFVAGRIEAWAGSAVTGNPTAKNVMAHVKEATSTQELAKTMADSYRATGTVNGRFDDAVTEGITHQFDLIAQGSAEADPALIDALDNARMKYTKWGEERMKAVVEKAASNPFLYEQVKRGSMVYNDKMGSFLPPSIATSLGAIQDDTLRGLVMGALPKDATGGVIGYSVSSPVNGNGTPNADFSVPRANSQVFQSTVVAAAAASLDTLPTIKISDISGNQIDSPFTPVTVDNIRAWARSDMDGVKMPKEGQKYSLKDSAAPDFVKKHFTPELMDLWNKGDANAKQAAYAGAIASAYKEGNLSAVSTLDKGYSGIIDFMSNNNVLSPEESAVLYGEKANGMTANSALLITNTIDSALERLKVSNPDEFARVGQEWDSNIGIFDYLRSDGVGASVGDPEYRWSGLLSDAKSVNRTMRSALGTNVYGIDDASADAIIGLADRISNSLGTRRGDYTPVYMNPFNR